jgi:hypothetical protein
MEQTYDPNHPMNRFPKFRHSEHLDPETGLLEASVIVHNPDEEKALTPASEGWYDLKRDAVDAAAIRAKKLKAQATPVKGKPVVATDA